MTERKLTAYWELNTFPIHIECAAIKFYGKIYAMERPNRHHNIIAFIGEETGWRLCQHDSKQGFLTSRGRFVDRKEAEVIARNCGQINGKLIGSVLTSEDMW